MTATAAAFRPRYYSEKGPGAVGAAPVMVRNLVGGSNVTQRTCSVGDGRPVFGHGYCEAHAKRLRDHGDVMAHIPIGKTRRPKEPIEVRFWAEVDATGDCWEYTRRLTPGGYGSVRLPLTGRAMVAHRFAWLSLVGPIPEGYELDHRCRNAPCVNPAHLEPVTPLENKRRVKRLYTRAAA